MVPQDGVCVFTGGDRCSISSTPGLVELGLGRCMLHRGGLVLARRMMKQLRARAALVFKLGVTRRQCLHAQHVVFTSDGNNTTVYTSYLHAALQLLQRCCAALNLCVARRRKLAAALLPLRLHHSQRALVLLLRVCSQSPCSVCVYSILRLACIAMVVPCRWRSCASAASARFCAACSTAWCSCVGKCLVGNNDST